LNSDVKEKKEEEGGGGGGGEEGEGGGGGGEEKEEKEEENDDNNNKPKTLSVFEIRKLRAQFPLDVQGIKESHATISKWNKEMQAALASGRKTKKWVAGPPLPFEFLPPEEQEKILAQKAAAETLRKDQELKKLLGGEKGGTEDNAKEKSKTPKKKTKKK
jgi:hypothetical protein